VVNPTAHHQADREYLTQAQAVTDNMRVGHYDLSGKTTGQDLNGRRFAVKIASSTPSNVTRPTNVPLILFSRKSRISLITVNRHHRSFDGFCVLFLFLLLVPVLKALYLSRHSLCIWPTQQENTLALLGAIRLFTVSFSFSRDRRSLQWSFAPNARTFFNLFLQQ